MNTDDKITFLKNNLAIYHKVIVAYSGGVDSTFGRFTQIARLSMDQLGP